MKTYKEYVLEASIVFEEAIDLIGDLIINLAMSGELKEVNDLFKEGEEMVFKYEDFKNLSDYNVKLLDEVYVFLEAKRRELVNVNGLGGGLPF